MSSANSAEITDHLIKFDGETFKCCDLVENMLSSLSLHLNAQHTK